MNDGQELVVDGEHRLIKAVKLGIKKLFYKRVTPKMMSDSVIK